MINIDIDTQGLVDQFGLAKSEVDQMMEYTIDQVTSEFAYLWQQEAKAELNSTRNQFINAVQVSKRGRFTGVAYLNPAAWLPNALEIGASSFDMKTGFLNSPKAKSGVNGPYITIPFRFATSGSIGESNVFSGVLPPEIERKAKASEGALKLSYIPETHQIPKSAALRRKQESLSFKQHESIQKTSIYEGLVRRSSGGFMTFRRVSLNSDPHAFLHPGFQSRDFASKALPNLDIEGIMESAIDQFLINLGF